VHIPPDGDGAVILARTQARLPTVADVEAAAGVLAEAAVTAVQLELPIDVVDRSTAGHRRDHRKPCPHAPLPAVVMRRLDVLVVNAAEAATMLGSTSRQVVDDPVGKPRALLSQPGAVPRRTTEPSRGATH
jgi:hypothetical protein